MKFAHIALCSIIGFCGCAAFGPSPQQCIVPRTPLILNAKTLEGWKIDGVVKPSNNFVLVQSADLQGETDTGILLTTKIAKTEGIVVSVGPGSYHKDSGIPYPMPVDPGNGVVYGQYDGIAIDVDGKTHTLIRDSDILVKFSASDSLSLDTVDAVNDSVLVYVDTDNSVTTGGLLLGASDDRKRPSTGIVTKVGPGRMSSNGELMPMTVAVGDQVKFMDFAGNEVKIEDKDYSVVSMPEILAKF